MPGSDFNATNRIPHFHEPVRPDGSQAISLRTPGQAMRTTLMGLENLDLRSLFEPFDHTNGPVLRAGAAPAPSADAGRRRPDQGRPAGG